MSRYTTNEEEKQLYPNLRGLTSPEEIAEAEFEGFLLAEIMLTEQLTCATHFLYLQDTSFGPGRVILLCR